MFVFNIRFMLKARLNVTDIGNPSGTDTTISVTAIIKLLSNDETMSRVPIASSATITLNDRSTNVGKILGYQGTISDLKKAIGDLEAEAKLV